MTWQIQYTGEIDTSLDVQVFNLDLFDTSASTVSDLHNKDKKVICYISAGSYENWRPDAGQFPSSVLGTPLDGWPGERWLDVRQISILEPIMAARMDLCASKGFDAIDPDNVDGYTQNSGFSIKASDQLAYNRMLVRLAHERGLSIGLKNNVEQASQLVDDFDFATNEECYEWNECDQLLPFINSDKAVFHIEYAARTNQFCPITRPLEFSSLKKRLQLDSWRETC